MNDKIKVVAFDADDTLWENQAYFDEAEAKFCRLMSCYGDDSFLRQELFNTEMQNMETLGYGAMAFTLSMIETALRLSDGAISGTEIRELYGNGKNLLENPATPFPGVEETLETITSTRPYKMIVITKGNTADQQNNRNTWQHEITEEFDHPNLFRITGFKELTDIL